MNNLALIPALELAQLIRQRQISPLELTQFFLDRISRFDSQVGSFFHVASESAIADARAKTEQLVKTSDPNQLPPFLGFRLLLKTSMPLRECLLAMVLRP
jgi:amidase